MREENCFYGDVAFWKLQTSGKPTVAGIFLFLLFTGIGLAFYGAAYSIYQDTPQAVIPIGFFLLFGTISLFAVYFVITNGKKQQAKFELLLKRGVRAEGTLINVFRKRLRGDVGGRSSRIKYKTIVKFDDRMLGSHWKKREPEFDVGQTIPVWHLPHDTSIFYIDLDGYMSELMSNGDG